VSASVRTTVDIDGRAVTLSNPEKLLWPEDGITKGELVAYYRDVAAFIVPHLADRPLTLERYPDGIADESFFEKHAPRGIPDWVRTIEIPSEHGKRATTNFVICDDEATLAYVANLGSIVLHVWTSKASSLDVPEFVFFDLDPHDGCTIATLGRVAVGMRDVLREVGARAARQELGRLGTARRRPARARLYLRRLQGVRGDRGSDAARSAARAHDAAARARAAAARHGLPRLRAGRARQNARRAVQRAAARRRAGLDAAGLE